MSEFATLAIMLIASIVSSEIATRLKVPAVIGPLVVGVIIGPHLLNLVHMDHSIEFITEMGVMGLMFIAGLETDLKLLKKYLRPSLLVALFGAIVPLLVFWIACNFGGAGNKMGLFYGITFAAMSTSITVNVLKEQNAMQTKSGVTILGAAIVDDVIAMLSLALYIAIFAPSASETSLPLWLTILLEILFFVIVIVAIRFMVPWVMHNIVPHLRYNIQINVISGWVIMLVLAAVAVQFGLSAIIGAFFAGVAISQTDVKDEIEVATDSAQYGLFIPVFLTSVGLNVDISVLPKVWPVVLGLTFLAVVTKLIGSGFGAKISGYSWMDSTVVGSGTIPRGEFSIVIAQIGLTNKIITGEVYSEILVVIILATIIGPLLLSYFIDRSRALN
ncbi:MAG: cation:proton antiporter [Lactobacillaceae bacterium]|jgi:Kef-type K+ transport system membrane component KefB|nr:cation:proton antiporter [Lactobacillaceae bacterium]